MDDPSSINNRTTKSTKFSSTQLSNMGNAYSNAAVPQWKQIEIEKKEKAMQAALKKKKQIEKMKQEKLIKERGCGWIVWCDSDPNIADSAKLIKKSGYGLRIYNETADCLRAVTEQELDPEFVKAIITSGMRGGGRKEKGLMDGLEMINEIKSFFIDLENEYSEGWWPIFAVVSKFAIPADEAAEKGIRIIASYDIVDTNDIRKYVQERVLEVLTTFNEERKALTTAFSRSPTGSCQENEKMCFKFLVSLFKNQFGHYQYFDNYANHCFCSKCEPEMVFYRGDPKEKYVLPIGWYRFGIKIRDDVLREEIENWHVAYHGAPTNRVWSIMQHQRIMFPGDKLMDGTILEVRLNNCYAQKVSPDGKVIYCSPTIKYAGHPNYAKPKRWKVDNDDDDDKKENDKYKGLVGQVVFQCRVKPNCYTKSKQTLRQNNYDSNIPDNEIEWITADRKGIAPYAVLVRLSQQTAFPKKYIDD